MLEAMSDERAAELAPAPEIAREPDRQAQAGAAAPQVTWAMSMQRRAGNRAVARVLGEPNRREAEQAEAPRGGPTRAVSAPDVYRFPGLFGWNWNVLDELFGDNSSQEEERSADDAVDEAATDTDTQTDPAVDDTDTDTDPAVDEAATDTDTQTDPAVDDTDTDTHTDPAVDDTDTDTHTTTQPSTTPTPTQPKPTQPSTTPTPTPKPTQPSTNTDTDTHTDPAVDDTDTDTHTDPAVDDTDTDTQTDPAVDDTRASAAPAGDGGSDTAAPSGAATGDQPVVGSRAEARSTLTRPTPTVPPLSPFSGESDPGVRRWQAGVGAARSAIPEPALDQVRASPGQLREQSHRTDRRRRTDRPDAEQEAAEVMPPVPQPDEPIPAPPPDPVPAATALIEAAGERRLPSQTLPTPNRSPAVDDPGWNIHISGLLPGERPPAPSPATAANLPPGAATETSTESGRPDMEQASGDAQGDHETATEPAPAPAPVTLTDEGPPSTEPMPAELQADMGEVIARLLSSVERTATHLVTASMTQAFPGGVLTEVAPELGEEKNSLVEQEIRTELHGVAEAAGIEVEAVDARAAELRHAAEEEANQASMELEETGTEAASLTCERSEEEQSEVAGAAAANEREIDRRQEAASGEVDEAAVERETTAMITRIQRDASVVRANQRLAKETREREIGTAGSQLSGGYRTTATAQMRAIRSAYESGDPVGEVDPETVSRERAGIQAAIPTSSWMRRNSAAVTTAVAELQRELTRVTREQTTSLDNDEQAAVEMVRTWRDERLGTERSWWQRLLDLFTDWGASANESTAAWAEVRNRGTRDRATEDFGLLAEARDAMASGNQERITAVGEGLDNAQRTVLQTYFSSGGDAVAAVAAGMMTRLSERRLPEITEQLRTSAEGLDDWQKLERLGQAQTSGFNAQTAAIEVHAGVDGMGTDEDRIYRALSGKTRIQTSAIRGAYSALGYGDIDDDLAGDLSESELDRARQMMEGDEVGAEIAELRYATEQWGTDEATIMRVLRNKTPEQRAEIVRRYEEMYPGSSLSAELRDDLNDTQFDQAGALLAGDTARADALALQEAMEGAATDEEGINAVYGQIRSDVEAEAMRTGMSTAEVEAEIRRRNGEIATQYGALSGEGADALARDFGEELSDAELDLATAFASGNQTDIDAATIRVEERALFDTDDDRIIGVLRNQRARAEREAERDLRQEWQVEATTEGWNSREAARRWQTGYQPRAEAEADRQAERNMGALEDAYDEDYGSPWGPGSLQVVVAFSMGGEDQDMAWDLIRQNGQLRPEQEIEYAIGGAGTDEDSIRRVLRDPRTGRLKTPEQIQEIRAAYERTHGSGSFNRDILDELSGRDEFDIGDMLQGEPRTPEERMRRLQAREQFDRGNQPDGWDAALAVAFPAYGVYQLAAGNGIGQYLAGEEGTALDRSMDWAGDAYDDYEAALAGRDPSSPEVQNDPAVRAAREAFERRVTGADAAIDDHRRAVDSAADTISTVAAVAAGIAVIAASGGTLTPAVAAAGAAAATAATVVTKAIILGDAYGIEDIGTDLAVGAVDVAAAVLTAGVGNALLRTSALARLAGRGVIGRVGVGLVAEGAESALGAIPSGMAQVMLDDNTWRHPNPMLLIAQASGQAAVMSVAMSGGMSLGGAAYGRIRGAGGGGGGPSGAHPDAPSPAARASSLESDIPPSAFPDDAAGRNPLTDTAAGRGEPVVPDGAPPVRPDGAPPVRPDGAPPTDAGPVQRPTEAPAQPADLRNPGADGDAPSAPREPHVGDDGIIDLDDPRNAFMIDGMAGSLPGSAAFDPAQADDFFEGFVRAHPDLEVALVRNTETGEHMIFQGNHQQVGFATLDDAIAALVPAGRSGRGRWVPEMHSHPVLRDGFTPEASRAPSSMDWNALAFEARARGGPVDHRIRVETPRGREEVHLRFDPGADRELHVDIPLPDGTRLRESFATLDDYADWYRQRFGAPLDGVPAGYTGRRRTIDFEDEPTQVTQRPDFEDEPTQVTQRPGFEDEPTQVTQRPGFEDEPTQVTQRPGFEDEPTQVTQRPDFEDEPTQVGGTPPDLSAPRSRAAEIRDAGNLDDVRAEVAALPDAERAVRAEELQAARVAITEQHVAPALQEIQSRYPDLEISVHDVGTRGLNSDRDLTIRADPADPAAYAALSDAQRQAFDRRMVQASAEAVPVAYAALDAAGFPPDRSLDTNFYTELHEGRVQPTSAAERAEIHADQEVVSLTELALSVDQSQWRRFIADQRRQLAAIEASPGDIAAMRRRFDGQLREARARADRLAGPRGADGRYADGDGSALRDARERLIAAMGREPPPSAREARQLMADVKLLEPDAYGSRAAVESVVLGDQGMRSAMLEQVQEAGFRTELDIRSHVGEPGPRRLDPETGQMVEISAEAESLRRQREARPHVGSRSSESEPLTAYEQNARSLAMAQAVHGHMVQHGSGAAQAGGPELGNSAIRSASSTGKNLRRIVGAAHDANLARPNSGGFAHLEAIAAAKNANNAGEAMQAALGDWAIEPEVIAWASANGQSLGSTADQAAAFQSWSQAEADRLLGRMRARTSTAAAYQSAPTGRSDIASNGGDGTTDAQSAPPPLSAPRRPGGDGPGDTTPGEAPSVPRRTRSGDIIDEGGHAGPAEATTTDHVRREFHEEDRQSDLPFNARYFAHSRLDGDGTMTMDFSLREARNGEMHRAGVLRGSAEFTAAVEHFRRIHGSDAVRRIQGNWGLGDNLDHFRSRTRELVGLGMSLHDAQILAASETTTGRWAEAAGFGHIAKIDDTGGEVTVMFEAGTSNAPPPPALPTPRLMAAGSDTADTERPTSPTDEGAVQSTEGRRGGAPTSETAPSPTPSAASTDTTGHLPAVRRSIEATFEQSGPAPETYIQAASWYEYYETWRASDPSRGPGDLPEGPAYFDRRQRKVFLAPEILATTVAHETLHALTHDDFHALVPDWLNEGVTDLLTERSMGARSPDSAYDENVAFAALLQRVVGEDVLRGAYFDGNMDALEAALDARSGVEGTLGRLRNLLPSDGSARADPDLLEAAKSLLAGGAAVGNRGDRSERPTIPPDGGHAE